MSYLTAVNFSCVSKKPLENSTSKKLCFRCLLDGHQSENCVKRNECHPTVTANIIICCIIINVSQKKTTDAVQDTKLKEELRKGIETATTSYVKKLAPQKIALRTIPVTLETLATLPGS